MNIEFRPQELQHETAEQIFFEGEKIGDMYSYPRDYSPFHASLTGHAPDWLIQGFGDTKEEAIKNALIQQRVEIERQTQLVADLEAKLFGKGE